MTSVLVLDSDAGDRAFARDALRVAGYEVTAPSAGCASPEEIVRADVVVAELDAAIASRLFRSPRRSHVPTTVRLVIATRFATFLPALGERVAAVVRKPLVGEKLVEAVSDVLSGRPRGLLPAPHWPNAPMEDPPSDPELYAIADLISRGVGTAAGLVTVLSGDRQIFAGHVGLPPDLVAASGMPRAWSICHHAASARAPLVVPDARDHPALADSPAVTLNFVRAYAGVPISVAGHGAIGTVCAISLEPRAFSARDLATLELGARLAGARLAVHLATPSVPAARPSLRERSPAIGELIDDKFYITGRLGDGGQSNVLFARDRLTGQLVAIKIVHAAGGEASLVREATALSSVRHPNIVQVHGWGRTDDGRFYLVLEYVEGRTLADQLSESRATGVLLRHEQAMKIVREIGGALATLHGAGVVHGDIKPSNVLLDPALDRAVLIDFGLGLGNAPWRAVADGQEAGLSGGTPGYSAPEQLTGKGRPAEPEKVDVYGIAALAYAALLAIGPFERVRASMRPVAQLRGDIVPPSTLRSELPDSVDRVLVRALSPEPAHRPSSVLAFVDALDRAMHGIAPASLKPIGFEPRSRGIVFANTRRAARAIVGDEDEAALFASLPSEVREGLDAAVQRKEFYPAAPIVAYLRAYAGGDRAKLEALGESASSRCLPKTLTALRVTRTPEALLHAVQPLMARFQDWGKIDIETTGTNEAVARLSLPSGFAPEICHLLGGVARTLLATGGRRTTVGHVACRAQGDTACALHLSWTEG